VGETLCFLWISWIPRGSWISWGLGVLWKHRF